MIEEQMNGQRKGHEKERTGTCAMNNDHDYHRYTTEGEERRQAVCVFIYWR